MTTVEAGVSRVGPVPALAEIDSAAQMHVSRLLSRILARLRADLAADWSPR